jgi:hypothetical protein
LPERHGSFALPVDPSFPAIVPGMTGMVQELSEKIREFSRDIRSELLPYCES